MSLLKGRDEPIRVDMVANEHLDYLGARFVNGHVHRNYMSACPQPPTRDEMILPNAHAEKRSVTWTQQQRKEFNASLEADIVKLVQGLADGACYGSAKGGGEYT